MIGLTNRILRQLSYLMEKKNALYSASVSSYKVTNIQSWELHPAASV